MLDDSGKYYINGKQYIPAESDILCITPSSGAFDLDLLGDTERTTLYRTKKGAYFLEHISKRNTEVSVITESEAMEFMNTNSAGIITAVYDRIFGTPEKG